jgi:proteasome beta subunit
MSAGRPIAGDFLSLLADHSIPPISARMTEGAPAQTQGTTVFAFAFSEGVMIVGDRRATAGNVIVTDTVDKVIELDSGSVLAIAGVPATAFEMARVLQTSFEYYRRSQLQALSLAAKVRALARLLRDNVPMTVQGLGIVVPIFAGVDRHGENPGPKIFFYDALGAQFQAVDFAASGSGSMTIRSVLRFQEKHGETKPSRMTRAEAGRFALRLLMTAAELDSATGGVNPATRSFATIRVLTDGGIEAVDDEAQAAWMA